MTASPLTVLGRASPVWLVITVSARILVVHMGAQWSTKSWSYINFSIGGAMSLAEVENMAIVQPPRNF